MRIPHWTQDRRTKEEKQDDLIDRLATAGALLSRHCRNCWTGERTRSQINANEFTGSVRDLIIIASNLHGKALIDYASGADLHGFYLGASDQHTWDKARWEKEIRTRMPG